MGTFSLLPRKGGRGGWTEDGYKLGRCLRGEDHLGILPFPFSFLKQSGQIGTSKAIRICTCSDIALL